MSATSHDAIHGHADNRLKIGASTLDVSDPTEDIADEITTELAGVPAADGAAPIPETTVATSGEAARQDAPAAGTVLRDRYILETLIGSGGTAEVFRASDLRRDSGGQPVAVKLLRPERRSEPRSIGRLQREFRQTQTAAHRNVVRFYDLDCDRGSWFIIMELLAGETLAARLRRAVPVGLPVKEATVVAAEAADALAHAHALGVIHGDVKPANIFITEAGEVRLLDFGVSPESNAPLEPTTGTRAYASPEILGGEQAEPGDDVFSLSCVTCEMISGIHPYGRGGADAAARAHVLPQRPAGLDDRLWRVLEHALDLRRVMRPGMSELAGALRGAPVPAEAASEAVVPMVPMVPVMPEVPAIPVAVVRPETTAARGVSPDLPARRTRLVAVGAMAAGLMLVLGILIGRLEQGAEPVSSLPSPEPPAKRIEALVLPAPVPVPAVISAAPAKQPKVGGASSPDNMQPRPFASTGLVTFDLPSMSVSNRAVVAAIPLRHLSGTQRDVRVNWRILEGSARPGRDYGGPESGVESFVAGNNFRILYVPIVANPPVPQDRTFVVELTGATPGVEVGVAPRVAVTILGDG